MEKINFEGTKVAVLGFGIEGKDAVEFLLKKKAKVTVFDKKTKNELDLNGFKNNKVSFSLGKDYFAKGLTGFDYIVRSPGFYRYLPEIIEAEKTGTDVTSTTKIFLDLAQCEIIGITGTKGKGTTSTLIYKILKKADKDAYLAGNIGTPVLKLLPKLKKESLVVLELSSFQLIDLHKSPHIAVVLNITEDHMDWHKDKAEYVKAKKNIVKFQKDSDYAIINSQYQLTKDFAAETKAKVVYFSSDDVGGTLRKKLLLRGKHNLENVASALAVSNIVSVKKTTAEKVISSFKGLEHRLELVSTANGISFYNDSFATGPQPTIAAIKSFNEPLTLILGGYDKGLDYSGLFGEIGKFNNLKTVVLIGDLAAKFEKMLKKGNFSGKIVNLGKNSMKEIIWTAKEYTPKSGVVLLSPAAASFDMFEDYKQRGELFKKEVKNLKTA